MSGESMVSAVYLESFYSESLLVVPGTRVALMVFFVAIFNFLARKF